MTAFACGVAAIAIVSFASLGREPIIDPNKVIFLRIILSLAVTIIGGVVGGLIHVELDRKGLAVRASGAVSFFVLTFFFNPAILPVPPPPSAPSSALPPLAKLSDQDFSSIVKNARAKQQEKGLKIALNDENWHGFWDMAEAERPSLESHNPPAYSKAIQNLCYYAMNMYHLSDLEASPELKYFASPTPNYSLRDWLVCLQNEQVTIELDDGPDRKPVKITAPMNWWLLYISFYRGFAIKANTINLTKYWKKIAPISVEDKKRLFSFAFTAEVENQRKLFDDGLLYPIYKDWSDGTRQPTKEEMLGRLKPLILGEIQKLPRP